MSNSLLVFEGHDVEVFELDNVVYFNPRHVAECLDLTDGAVRMAIKKMTPNQVRKLKNSDVKNVDIRRKLNNAGENFFTESGVYKLAFQSRRPEAERFSNWVTDDVLPQIRKTGGYIPTVTTNATPMTDEQIMAQALIIAQKTIETRNQEIAAAKQTIAQKECELIKANDAIGIMEPKADYYDTILKAENLVSITCIADDYGISGQKMNKLLHEWGIQYKRGDKWYLYDKYKGLGYVGNSTYDGNHKDGTPAAFSHMMWTQVGRKFINGLMKDHGYSTLAEQAGEALMAATCQI